MNYARRPGIDGEALRKLAAREHDAFVATHAESARLAKLSAAHWLKLASTCSMTYALLLRQRTGTPCTG